MASFVQVNHKAEKTKEKPGMMGIGTKETPVYCKVGG